MEAEEEEAAVEVGEGVGELDMEAKRRRRVAGCVGCVRRGRVVCDAENSVAVEECRMLGCRLARV